MANRDASSDDAIDVGSRLNLMVDDHLVDRFEGRAELRLHRPVEREVVFTCDQAWEGDWSGMLTFIQDSDICRVYYTAGSWSRGRTSICYAHSSDGIHWARPELGLVEFDGSRQNNIILPAEGIIAFVPFKDTNPDARPEEQYKAIVARKDPVRGLYGMSSPDGIRWKSMHQDPMITKGYFDSQNVAFWDTVRGRYVAFYREMRGPNDEVRPDGPQLGLDDEGPARDVMTCTSPDFLNWSDPQWLQYPGAPREQIYLNQIRPYCRAPQLFVGFPGRFMAGREIDESLPITEHPAYRYGSISETLFMTSRDGVHFNRWGEAFIRPGPRKERWIYGATFPEYGLLVTKADPADMPDELSLYVQDGGSWTQRGKATRFRRYTLRIDGFVSVQAPFGGGAFVTKLIAFDGRELVINFATSAAGSVRVEIQDVKGVPIPGYGLSEATEIFGDQIDGTVTWNRGSDVSRLSGRPIRLRVELRDADLYSFRLA